MSDLNEIEQQMNYDWTQPCCEACWINREGEWDLASDDTDVWQVLVTVRQPILLKQTLIERCAFCGAPTIIGLYIREDPANVEFPRIKKESHED